jgi:hypothetical protein
MLKAIKDKWVAALRADKRPNLSGAMMEAECPCALAILILEVGENPTPNKSSYNRVKELGLNFMVESPVGLSQCWAFEAVYRLSDTGVPPKKIADWVEKNVPAE